MNRLRLSDGRDRFRQKNYTKDNPVISIMMNNFIIRNKKLLKKINGRKLFGLDAGCGEGHMLLQFANEKIIKDMAAVDIRMDHINYAKKFGPPLNYYRADLYALGFKDDVFDFIICTEVLEHLPNPSMAMMELRRVAKTNAHLIVSVPFEPFFSWGNILRGKYWRRGGRSPYHCNFWKKSEFESFIASYVDIFEKFSFKTFPWVLFHGRFR